MNLADYFEQTKGRGVLATSNAEGKVNAAVYSRPYFSDDETVAFIMAERLTHENLKSNPWAIFLFMEDLPGYKGKRLYLKKVKDEQNDQLISEICRRCDYSHHDIGTRYVVHFTVEKVLPLIGDHEKV